MFFLLIQAADCRKDDPFIPSGLNDVSKNTMSSILSLFWDPDKCDDDDVIQCDVYDDDNYDLDDDSRDFYFLIKIINIFLEEKDEFSLTLIIMGIVMLMMSNV